MAVLMRDIDEVFMTTSEVLGRYRISRASLWRWQKNANVGFPSPVMFGSKKRYRLSDLIAFEGRRSGGRLAL